MDSTAFIDSLRKNLSDKDLLVLYFDEYRNKVTRKEAFKHFGYFYIANVFFSDHIYSIKNDQNVSFSLKREIISFVESELSILIRDYPDKVNGIFEKHGVKKDDTKYFFDFVFPKDNIGDLVLEEYIDCLLSFNARLFDRFKVSFDTSKAIYFIHGVFSAISI